MVSLFLSRDLKWTFPFFALKVSVFWTFYFYKTETLYSLVLPNTVQWILTIPLQTEIPKHGTCSLSLVVKLILLKQSIFKCMLETHVHINSTNTCKVWNEWLLGVVRQILLFVTSIPQPVFRTYSTVYEKKVPSNPWR